MGIGEDGDEPLRIVASGGLEIWLGTERVDNRIPAKAALLIVYLADRAAPVARSTVAGLLWSDHTEEQARTSLRVMLTRTRQHVPQVQADRSTVALLGDVTFDVHDIEHGEHGETYQREVGEFLAGVEVDGAGLFEDWLRTRREEHRTLIMRSFAAEASAAAREGRWVDLASISRRTIDVEPWNEPAYRHLMVALAETEGRAVALAAFEQCTSVLLDEFGVLPDDETSALVDSIRAGSSSTGGATLPARAPSTRAIQWRLLGDVEVTIDGVVHDLGGRHRRSVMAFLAVRAPQRCSVEDIVAAVWAGPPPATARQAVGRHVRDLQDLAPEIGQRIERVPDGFRLAALADEVDARRAREAITSARAQLRDGEIEAARKALREALTGWNGASLGGVARHGPLGAERASLDELRLGAIEDLIEAELALDRHREIASEVEAFALDHPTRARAWGSLMLARARTGRTPAAEDAYRQFCENLAALGLTAPQSIEALHRQILADAPAVQPSDSAGWSGDAAWRLPATTFSVPLPPAFERSGLVTLAGREDELAALEAAFDAGGRTGASAFFIAGEPGIGKTRLAAELAKYAHDAGAAVLYGRCDESPGAPFRAWRDALAPLADHVPPHIARRHHDRFGPSLRLLMPTLADRVDGEDPHDSADANQQELLFRAAAGLLSDVAHRRRLVVVIDDMQWAHPSTIELLRHVARDCTQPVLLLGLYRSTDVADAHPLRSVIADLEQADLGSVIELDGLDETSRSNLVRTMLHDDVAEFAPEIAAKIANETGGNPFFFTEVLRSIRESELVESILDASVETLVPPTVQRVVTQRVARLGTDVADLLGVASVFGREFDLEILSIVAERAEDDLLTSLEAALTARLISDAPSGRDRFAFTHDLVHHTLSGQLSQSRRGRIHGQIADAMRRVHGPGPGDHIPVVAGHLVAADDPRRNDETITACGEAGRYAAAQVATAEAIDWFERALSRLGSGDDHRRAGLLVELGIQQRNAALASHRATLIEAGQLALAAGAADTVVSAALANSRGMNAHVWELDHERVAMLHAALDALGPADTSARAELLASLANEQWDAEHLAVSEDNYREAMALARRCGDTDTLARVLIRVSRARNFRLERDEMAAASAELARIADRFVLGDPLLLANCLTTVLNTSIRLGLAEETAGAIEAIEEAAERIPLPMFTLPAHLARCLDAGLRGDVDRYDQEAEATLAHGTEIGDEEAGFIFEGHLFYSAYLRGDLAPLLDLSIEVMASRPDVPLYRAACTLIHTETELTAEARALLDEDVAVGIEPSVDMFQIQALVAWSDAAASLGHKAACAQLYDALIGLSTEMSGHLVQVGEPIDISLGRLATELDRFDAAERHFEIAQYIADSFGARWMDMQTGICRAEMLARRAAAGDLSRALDAAAMIASAAADLGFRGIAARAEALLDA